MINTPVNQVRLTNVAVVRYKTQGKRFEIACYKNKVQNYRDGVEAINNVNGLSETNLSEVLQIYEVFVNVSKGEIAKKAEVQKYLHKDKDEAIKMILTKGDLQVSELERESEFESLKLNIANIVSTMWVNKDTNVPFPVKIILKAMDDIKFNVKDGHTAKKQALLLIKELPSVLPLERAKMKIKFTCSNSEKAESIKQHMIDNFSESDNKEEEGAKLFILDGENPLENGGHELSYLILPRLIRDLQTFCNKDNDVSIEIVEHYVYSRLANAQEEEEAKKVYEDSLKQKQNEDEEWKVVFTQIDSTPMVDSKKSGKDKDSDIKCSTCNDATFDTKEEFKAHYKSEWHIENTKRKMSTKPRISETEFMIWKEEEIGRNIDNYHLDREMFSKNQKGKGKKEKKGRKNRNQN